MIGGDHVNQPCSYSCHSLICLGLSDLTDIILNSQYEAHRFVQAQRNSSVFVHLSQYESGALLVYQYIHTCDKKIFCASYLEAWGQTSGSVILPMSQEQLGLRFTVKTPAVRWSLYWPQDSNSNLLDSGKGSYPTEWHPVYYISLRVIKPKAFEFPTSGFPVTGISMAPALYTSVTALNQPLTTYNSVLHCFGLCFTIYIDLQYLYCFGLS